MSEIPRIRKSDGRPKASGSSFRNTTSRPLNARSFLEADLAGIIGQAGIKNWLVQS